MSNLMQQYMQEQSALTAKYQGLLAMEGLPQPAEIEGVFSFNMKVDMRLVLKRTPGDFASASHVQYALAKRLVSHVEKAIKTAEGRSNRIKINVGKITWGRQLFESRPMPTTIAADVPKSFQDVQVDLSVLGFGSEDLGIAFVRELLADEFACSPVLRDLEAAMVPGIYGLELEHRYYLD